MKYWFQYLKLNTEILVWGVGEMSETASYIHLMRILEGSVLEP